MSDLIERLRSVPKVWAGHVMHEDGIVPADGRIVHEAADEIERLTTERDDLRDVLLRNGFVQCDIPACNCGSWHHRYGLPERMQEIKDALAEAGHELSNANGNLTLNALKALISERDAMANVLPGHCYMDPPDGGDVPVLEQLRRMAKDAARYRWLRGREDGRYMTVYAFRTDVDEVCLGEELDATIDAARAADMMVLHGTKVREG